MARRERTGWEQARWIASFIVNMSQKYVKIEVRPEQLLKFADEIPAPLPPGERKGLMDKHLGFHKKKAWMKLKQDKEGNIKLFDEEDYRRLKARLKKK